MGQLQYSLDRLHAGWTALLSLAACSALQPQCQRTTSNHITQTTRHVSASWTNLLSCHTHVNNVINVTHCSNQPSACDISTHFFTDSAYIQEAQMKQTNQRSSYTFCCSPGPTHNPYSSLQHIISAVAQQATQILVLLQHRLQSRGWESLTAGLQSLRLASRLKPWLRTIDGLGWLMAASHGLRVQTRKLTAAN